MNNISQFKATNNIVIVVIAFALFMENLDVTIIGTSIPKMAEFFGINPISVKLALTSYLISLAIFIPISGWIAEKYGEKKVFITALCIFVISSILCGLSQNILELVFFRILQGFGGAMMMPVGRLILLKVYHRSDLVKINNWVSIPALLGSLMGPILGGIISNYTNWQWIFFINIPFGIIGIILAFKYIPIIPPLKINKFDLHGFIFFTIGLTGISLILSMVHQSLLNMYNTSLLLIISLISFILYAIHYKHAQYPMWDLAIFKIRTFRVTVIGSLFSRAGIGGIPFILPLLFQLGLHYNPLISGLLICPMAIALLLTKFVVNKILQTFGFKTILIFNTVMLGVIICSFALINYSTSYLIIIILVFIYGGFASIQFTCLNTLCYIDADANYLSQSTSIVASIQQLGTGFGVAMAAIYLNSFLSYAALRLLSTQAFTYTFLVIGIYTMLTGMIFSYLHHQDGQTISGHKAKLI